MSELRYCAYCDAFRERLRCESCGWTTHSLKTPPQSELPREWRAPSTPAEEASMADLADLLERVKAATGPDRELDRAISIALGILHEDRDVVLDLTGATLPRLYREEVDDEGRVHRVYGGHNDEILIRPYTASLDAALALVERVLPGIPRPEPCGPWEWRVHGPNRNDAGLCRAALTWPQTTAGAHAYLVGPVYGANPALALLAALLTALLAQAPAEDAA